MLIYRQIYNIIFEASKPAFKLAAYGVKQGGIGSVLAGGFPSLKKTGGPKKLSEPVRFMIITIVIVLAY